MLSLNIPEYKNDLTNVPLFSSDSFEVYERANIFGNKLVGLHEAEMALRIRSHNHYKRRCKLGLGEIG